MCLNLGKRVRSFIVAVERVCDQLMNILLGIGGEVSWQPSGPTGLLTVYILVGSIPQNSSKTLLCVSTDGETEPCPKAALNCFFLVSNPLPSLFNNCLSLPSGTQGRSWRLSEGCFL